MDPEHNAVVYIWVSPQSLMHSKIGLVKVIRLWGL